GHTPSRNLRSEILYIVASPLYLASFCLETSQRAHGTKHVDSIPIHGRCRAGTRGISRLQAGVICWPLASPQHGACLFVERENTLCPAVPLHTLPVNDKNTTPGNRGSGKQNANRGSPTDFQSVFGKRVEDTLFPEHSQATFAPPFRPIVGER